MYTHVFHGIWANAHYIATRTDLRKTQIKQEKALCLAEQLNGQQDLN